MSLMHSRGAVAFVGALATSAGLCAARAEAQPGPSRRGGPWHVDVEAVTDFPLDVGGGVVVELPYRLRLSSSLGVMPGPYARAINDVLVGLGAYSATVGELISASLTDSLVWRTHAGWRPFPRFGFYAAGGYTLVTLGGSLGPQQVVRATGIPAPDGFADIDRALHVGSTLHMLGAELGWTFIVAGWIPVRVAVGVAATVAASSRLYIADAAGQPRAVPSAAQSYLTRAGDWLAQQLRENCVVPTATLGVGFRAF